MNYKNIKYAVFLILILSLSGCGKKEDSVMNEKRESAKKETGGKIKTTEYKTGTGKVYKVTEFKKDSLSDISVSGTGFENSKDTVIFQNSDPFEEAILADLDGDGFEEIYIVTKSGRENAYKKILGIASNKDKSYSRVTVQNIDSADMKPGGYYEGYLGHDKISFKKNILVREFPVYEIKDNKVRPTGGLRRVFYKLVHGETSYVLKVDRKDDLK